MHLALLKGMTNNKTKDNKMKDTIKGYIGADGDFIYYSTGTDVYRAHKENAVDCITGFIIGRWECTLTQFNNYRDTVFSFIS